jgi:ABC-type bacteriocin/lantibiotic exporter with double-glycine peptidase domain
MFLLVRPLYAALMLFSRRVLRPLFADLEAAHGRYASHQIDAIKGIEAVKAAAAEQGFRDAMLAQFLRGLAAAVPRQLRDHARLPERACRRSAC